VSRRHGWLGLLVFAVLISVTVNGRAALGEELPSNESSGPQADVHSFSVELNYPTFGVAPQPPQIGRVDLAPGQEAQYGTWAVIEGLKRIGANVEVKDLEILIEPGEPWVTNIARIERELIDAHNKQASDVELPNNRLYGVRYSGSYFVKSTPLKDELSFQIGVELNQRGRQSEFIVREARTYEPKFFADRAMDSIIKAASDRSLKIDDEKKEDESGDIGGSIDAMDADEEGGS
jgi:hypothetical protein